MSFARALAAASPDPTGRRWLFVPYDQLTDQLGPLSRTDPREIGIVVVENPTKADRRPYHKQKLAWILVNLRHFALEQAARGVAVRHVVADGSYAEALRPVARELGGLTVMRPAERELRVDLAPLIAEGLLTEIPHEGWLTTAGDFAKAGKRPWRMDAFYRAVRRRTGLLMEAGKPVGGRFSFDGENRKRWPGTPQPPPVPTFVPDAITAEVGALIRTRFARHPGRLDLSTVAATQADAEQLWEWAKTACLPTFGPYEDAMSSTERTLWHTRISPLMHLHRLTPARVVAETDALELDLPSKEGFLRQVIGWREFMRHVHEATDGFNDLGPPSTVEGDGGWSGWSGESWGAPPSGAAPNALEAHNPVPPAFWGTPSGLACLDTVVQTVWEEGYSHHITRLMILSNLATLLDIDPRQLTDWFWVAYIDAYDWVVEPNVLAMGTFATGPLMTTKPYVSGSAYIHKMSDYCKTCRFHPKKTCPITPMYWAFLARNEERLAGNQRMSLPLRNVAKRAPEKRAADAAAFERVRDALLAGREVT